MKNEKKSNHSTACLQNKIGHLKLSESQKKFIESLIDNKKNHDDMKNNENTH